MKNYIAQNYKKWLILLAIIFIILFSIFPSVSFYYKENKSISEWGQLGDALNIAGTVLNAATLVFLALTFLSQKESFKKQQESLVNQENEMKEQRRLMQGQQETMKEQNNTMLAQQQIMERQLGQMETSTVLEVVKVHIEGLRRLIANFNYVDEAPNGSNTRHVGHDAFNELSKRLGVNRQMGKDDISLCVTVIKDITPIIRVLIACSRITAKNENMRELIKSTLPSDFKKTCLRLTGTGGDNIAYNTHMRNEYVQDFKYFITEISDVVWS